MKRTAYIEYDGHDGWGRPMTRRIDRRAQGLSPISAAVVTVDGTVYELTAYMDGRVELTSRPLDQRTATVTEWSNDA